MKKGLLFLPLVSLFALSSCDFFNKKPVEDTPTDDEYDVVPEITGGTDGEKTAILEAVNYKSICVNRGGSDLWPDSTGIRMNADDEDYIRLSKKVVVDSYTVEITWNIDQTQATFGKVLAMDATTDMVTFNYPGVGQPDGTFSWSISKIVCGGAVSTKCNSNYTAKILAATKEYIPMTMAEVYANHDSEKQVTVDGTTYTYPSYNDLVDYEYKNTKGYQPWWNTGRAADSDDNYIYCEISGKIIFLSEDGNWGLFANGEHVLEIYSGSKLDLNETKYPELKNKYVTIKGSLYHYYGNFQMEYIISIKACDKSLVTEPSGNYNNLTAEKLAALKGSDGLYKQFTTAVEHNQLVAVTGTITGEKVAGSNGRFTFEMTVGEHKVTIAYDYHTDKNTSTVKNALNAVYKVGDTVTIKGSYRFNNGVEKTLVKTDGSGGEFTIVPFLAADIIK